MQTVKTAISIQKSLYDRAEIIARQMKVSRSRLFALALEDYIQRAQNQKLLAQINAAYADDKPDATEKRVARKMRRTHRRLVGNKW